MKYPFVIDRKNSGKAKNVEANTYDNALNKVLAKHQGKRVTTTFAKRVDDFNNGRIRGDPPPLVSPEQKIIVKPIIKYLNTMDLISARVEAAAMSRQQRKKIYINTDDEGECVCSSIASKNPDNVQAAFVNGSEVKLGEEVAYDEIEIEETKTSKPKKSTKMEKVAKKKPVTKKQIKQVSKVKQVKKVNVPEVIAISGSSIMDGVKKFIAAKIRKSILKVAGKTYSIKIGANWTLSTGLIETGKDGIIMIAEGHNGFYTYPSSKYKELFGNIMASNTWKKNGSYGQSTFSSKHDEFWTPLK